MAKHIENVVVGKCICSLDQLFASSLYDWDEIEREQTLFTDERYLPRIMVECGVVKSVSEVKRNKSQFDVSLESVGFIDIKWGKRKLWICVGE